MLGLGELIRSLLPVHSVSALIYATHAYSMIEIIHGQTRPTARFVEGPRIAKFNINDRLTLYLVHSVIMNILYFLCSIRQCITYWALW